MADRVGQQLGKYRLVRKLGEGGFAEAYLGMHVHLGTQAAIKVLKTGLASQQEIEEFRREARTIANLVHPHIVRVLEFDIEQNMPFLVMDYAPNGSLAQRYPAGQRQPLAVILPHVRQIAEGLQHAHDQQTLHLDLKPANVLLGKQQEALIADFGIAVILQEHQTHQSLIQVPGTPAYMAPEHLQHRPGKESDQYALATMVYESLTGRLPFIGNVWSIGTQKLTQDPPPLRQYLPDLPSEVEQVILKALAREPQQRFGDVQTFAAELERASLSAVTVPVVGAVPVPTAPPPSGPLATTIQAANPPNGTAWAQGWQVGPTQPGMAPVNTIAGNPPASPTYNPAVLLSKPRTRWDSDPPPIGVSLAMGASWLIWVVVTCLNYQSIGPILAFDSSFDASPWVVPLVLSSVVLFFFWGWIMAQKTGELFGGYWNGIVGIVAISCASDICVSLYWTQKFGYGHDVGANIPLALVLLLPGLLPSIIPFILAILVALILTALGGAIGKSCSKFQN